MFALSSYTIMYISCNPPPITKVNTFTNVTFLMQTCLYDQVLRVSDVTVASVTILR